jgi:hypothetical protein
VTDFAGMRAAYLFDRTLADPERVQEIITAAERAGLTALITKAAAVTPRLRDACHAAGLAVVGSLACYSDHAEPAAQRRPELRPVGADGTWSTMEWYTGVIPTDPGYNVRLLECAAELAARGLLDAMVLDFLRWPLHWEWELRAGARPRAASFDPITLAAFRDRTGHQYLPDDPRAAAAMLLGDLAADWHAFRCGVIGEVAAGLRAAIRSGGDLPVGMFVVPAPDGERRTLVGQDVAALEPHVDAFLAMTYHRIVGRNPGWVHDIVADLRAHTRRPVLTMLQTTCDPALSRGADWGIGLTDAEFAALARAAGTPLCLFPAEGMDAARWRLLPTVLPARQGSLS